MPRRCPTLRSRLHFHHRQEGGPRKFVWTCGGIKKKPYLIIEFFLHPFQFRNRCHLPYQTPPTLQHTHVLCRNPKCSHLSFPNGSTLSLTNTSIYESLFCTKRGHLHRVNWWASQIPVLHRNKLPQIWSLLVLKIERLKSSSDYSQRFKTLHQ